MSIRDSKLTASVSQLAGLLRFAFNPAQSGFESRNAFLQKAAPCIPARENRPEGGLTLVLKGFGHESLSILFRYTHNLLSVRDPDAPAQRGPGLRLSNPCIPSNGKGHKRIHVCGLPIAGIQGFEPQLKASKASVLPLDDIPRLGALSARIM